MAVRQLRRRDDYFLPPDVGAPPAPHTHPPADITPQGGGSGLNADMVDGLHGADLQLVTQPALLRVRKNSIGTGGARHRINLIEGAGVTITLSDDAVDDEADVTIAATGVASGQAHTHVDHEVPSGSGTSFALAATPTTGTEQLFRNGLQLRRVASAPSLGEYSISGATITLGLTIGTDQLWAHYDTATPSTHAHSDHQTLSGSGAAWTLPATPLVGSEYLFVNGMQMRRVGASPLVGEYTISGTSVTLGWSLGGSDRIWAHYQT